MCYFIDILIYYFSPYSQSQHFMQDKPSEISSSNGRPVFQTTHPYVSPLDQKPLSSLKNAFAHWIRSLPMEERFVAARIHLPDALPLMRRIISRPEQPPQQRVQEQRNEHLLEQRKFCRKHQKNFYDSLVLVSDGHSFLNHICFDFSLLECPEKLYDLLMSAGEASANRTLQELAKTRKDLKSLNQRLYKLTARQQVSYELFAFLKQQVFINFNQNAKNGEAVTKALEEEKKRKKQFNNNWKFLSEEMKVKLLLLGHADSRSLREWLNDQGINVRQTDLDREIEELLKLQRNDFCNRIFKCKLKKLLSPMVGYYEAVYHQWRKEIEKFRKKRGMKYNRSERDYSSQQKTQYKESSKQQNRRHKKPRKSNSVESNQTNQTENSKNYHQKNQFQGKYAKQKDKDEFQKHQEMNEREDKIMHEAMRVVQQEKESHLQKQEVKTQTKRQINPEYEDVLELYPTPKKPVSISSSTSTKLSKSSQQQAQCQKRQQMKEHLRSICINKLNQEMQQISDKISEEANEFHDRRVIAFQRIQFLLQFYNVPIKLFGSCASGIAVRNSDIDIAIDNSILMFMDFLPQPERIKAALQRLEELFQTQKWITEIKFIKTATIPLIKLTINTSLPFFDPSIGEMYYQLNRQHNCGSINADITVQTKNKSQQCSHLGLISTSAINEWLVQISSLHSIVIILKEFFSRRKLNCTYQGGLNTFSMIVLMVAYIFHAKLEKQENSAFVFEKILRFYGEEFDERQRGIDILNKENNNIFYIKNLVNVEGSGNKLSKQKADLEIKDPMNQQKNMTRNCYSFQQIKRLFKEMLQNCFSRGYRQLQDLVKVNEDGKECKMTIDQLNREAFASRNVFIEFLNSTN